MRREADLAPGLPVRGRWAGLLGLVYLGGGLGRRGGRRAVAAGGVERAMKPGV